MREALAAGITASSGGVQAGGGIPGEVEAEELGLPGVTVELRDENGRVLEANTEPTVRSRSRTSSREHIAPPLAGHVLGAVRGAPGSASA